MESGKAPSLIFQPSRPLFSSEDFNYATYADFWCFGIYHAGADCSVERKEKAAIDAF
jgi:hypothetical protein